MLVPNSNYCKFEDWVMPILEAMLQEQQQQGTLWTPSKVSSAICWVAHLQHRGWAGGSSTQAARVLQQRGSLVHTDTARSTTSKGCVAR